MTDRVSLNRVASGGKSIEPGKAPPIPRRRDGSSFGDVLNAKLREGVKISAHAENRLQREGIHLDGAQSRRLGQAVDRAASRGARTSLVLMDDMAMIVNVKNRTLVTVVSGERRADGVFTDIDSAVIAR